MQSINRNAISVSARKPLIDWVNSLDPLNPIQYRKPIAYDDSTIYLIEELETEEDFNEWIRENYLELFEEELFGWVTDDSVWPAPLTYELFADWIQVTFQSVVMDLVDDEPIVHEDDISV
jgi:hypothetical protein